MKPFFRIFLYLLTFSFAVLPAMNAQSQADTGFISIHMEQAIQYSKHPAPAATETQSGSGKHLQFRPDNNLQLQKKVFGYHPYWAGSNYLNYQWHLLSDLCFFSYEVNPENGYPFTTHNWLTAPVIDTALAHGVKVHLCVTLFSGHALFFSNPDAGANLINSIAFLLAERNAHGVNIDFEAVPSVYADDLTAFMIDLRTALDTLHPGSEVSMASPAVNWSNTFQISILRHYVDFFMVMCYDYFWNGSGTAGPVSSLYSMMAGYDYSLHRTVSYYQSEGAGNEKLVIGVPYYGREWPTEGPEAPSTTTGYGTAYTYRTIRQNTGGHYSPQNKKWEPNSFTPYYSFQTTGWNQCFTEDTVSLGMKYNIVNRRNLSGIGIWALGYDDGYTELWDLLERKFSDNAQYVLTDSLFDAGGPAFDYYTGEDYLYTLSVPDDRIVKIEFEEFQLEEGHDSLWIYDGKDATAPLLGSYTGSSGPGALLSSGPFLTLGFQSDGNMNGAGWKAVYNSLPFTGSDEWTAQTRDGSGLFPNPVNTTMTVKFTLPEDGEVRFTGISPVGRRIEILSAHMDQGRHTLQIPPPNLTGMTQGIWLLIIECNNRIVHRLKFIKI